MGRTHLHHKFEGPSWSWRQVPLLGEPAEIPRRTWTRLEGCRGSTQDPSLELHIEGKRWWVWKNFRLFRSRNHQSTHNKEKTSIFITSICTARAIKICWVFHWFPLWFAAWDPLTPLSLTTLMCLRCTLPMLMLNSYGPGTVSGRKYTVPLSERKQKQLGKLNPITTPMKIPWNKEKTPTSDKTPMKIP